MQIASSSNSPCAACKFLRRKCTPECVFAPYFPPDSPQKFANVHKVFGASNVSKLLNELPPSRREDAVNSLAYEADARLSDPVYGCVGVISLLQHQLKQLQGDLQFARTELCRYMAAVGISGPLPASFLQTAMVAQQQQYYQQHRHQHHHASIATETGMGISSVGLPREQLYREQQPLVSQTQMAVATVLTARDQQETSINYHRGNLGSFDSASYDQPVGTAGPGGAGVGGLPFSGFGSAAGSPPPQSSTLGFVNPRQAHDPHHHLQILACVEGRKPCISSSATESGGGWCCHPSFVVNIHFYHRR